MAKNVALASSLTATGEWDFDVPVTCLPFRRDDAAAATSPIQATADVLSAAARGSSWLATKPTANEERENRAWFNVSHPTLHVSSNLMAEGGDRPSKASKAGKETTRAARRRKVSKPPADDLLALLAQHNDKHRPPRDAARSEQTCACVYKSACVCGGGKKRRAASSGAGGATAAARIAARRRSAAAATTTKRVGAALKPRSRNKGGRSARSSGGGDVDDDIKALLAAHNRKARAPPPAAPSAQPRVFGVRETMLWERRTGKRWLDLSAAERDAANEEIRELKMTDPAFF